MLQVFDVVPVYGHAELDLYRVQAAADLVAEYHTLVPKTVHFYIRCFLCLL